MHAIDRDDLTSHKYETNSQRVERRQEIEDAISSWSSTRTVDEVVEHMNKAGVPVGRVATVKDVVENEQLIARGALPEVPVSSNGGDWTVKMPATFPVLDGVDPLPRWAGPALGQHTEDVLKAFVGVTPGEIERLRREGIIA